jgi:hypothetical protein
MTAATSWLWYMTVSVGQHHLLVAGIRVGIQCSP